MKLGWRNGLEAGAGVEGERGLPAVHRERSLSARMSSVLAAALMGVLGLGALAWYYSNAATHGARVRASAQKTIANRVQGDAPLPSLGPIEPPVAPAAPAVPSPTHPSDPPSGSAIAAEWAGAGNSPANVLPSPITEAAAPLALYSNPDSPAVSAAPSVYATQSIKTPAQIELERRLTAPVFARSQEAGSVAGRSVTDGSMTGASHEFPDAVTASAPQGAPDARAASAASDPRERNATSAATAGLLGNGSFEARVLPTQRFLLPKGAYIDCTLETAIDSTLPGLTTCVTATDTFGADGTVVLLERGTKLVGETRGQVLQGTARVGVIWVEARTPTGVVVPLGSPATDELGRSGLPGTVNRHFWERFGAAILITTLDGAVQAAVQSSAHGSGTVLYSPGASEAVGTEALKGTLNIPPTVVKKQGDRVQAIVARDIDFRSVYELRLVPTSR
jgi:type IV secretion system protein VirB10